jgi:TRAP-type C4-dicarboxylate transport system substrate-binding protein
MAEWYLEQLAERTGLVEFEYHWAGELTPARETLPAVRSGAVDISNPPPAYYPGDEPLLSLFNAGRVPEEPEVAMRQGMEIMWYSGEVSDILQAEHRAQNTELLFWFPMHYIIVTKPKVEKLADLNGLKLRGVGIYEPDVEKTWGIIPVAAFPAEFYESLQRGSLDGLSAIYDNFTDYKLYEVAKWASFRNGAIMSQPMCFNLDVWNNEVPQEVKDLVESREFRQETLDMFMEIFDEKNANTIQIMKDNGVTFVDVDPAEQQEVWDRWKEVMITNFPIETEARGVGAEGMKVLDKWMELVTGNNLDWWDKKFGITR